MTSVARGVSRPLALGLVLGLSLAACGGPDATPAASPSPSPTPAVVTGAGVTAEPCPEGDPSRGCLYLAILSDLSPEGPFVSFGAAVADGAAAFWRQVNAAGGIAGFDVDVTTYTRDTGGDVAAHAAAVAEVAPSVLAVALSFGTETTLAGRDTLDAADLVTVPASFWSGWTHDPLFLPSGYSYCTEAMDLLDLATSDAPPASVVSVHFDDLYGRDHAAGVARWAAATGVAFDPAAHDLATGPSDQTGGQDAVVERILDLAPEVVVAATGPLELAELAGKLTTQGFEGRFLGSVPTFTPTLLDDPLIAESLAGRYQLAMPWEPWGSDSDAHRAMAVSLDGELPPNDGFTFGWIWSYPLLAALEHAAAGGELSPAAVRAAVGEVTVDYAGALPSRTYGGGVPSEAGRGAILAQPDADAPLGVEALTPLTVGPAAAAADLSEPCAAPRP